LCRITYEKDMELVNLLYGFSSRLQEEYVCWGD
jgi:hypothetical protein